MTKQEFLQMAIEAAQATSKSSGLPAGITVAQAALESAWGQSELSLRANNYFGIKAHGKHAVVEMPTTEYGPTREWSAGGPPAQLKHVTARFAAYDSIADCFACRDRQILNGAAYADARANLNDPELFARALARHWATDPNYADKLLHIYRENNLSRLDASAGAVGTPAL